MTTPRPPTYWVGTPPEKCDICTRAIKDLFVDGRTVLGPWGNLCKDCHATHGVGLGLGKGQRYEKREIEIYKPAPPLSVGAVMGTKEPTGEKVTQWVKTGG